MYRWIEGRAQEIISTRGGALNRSAPLIPALVNRDYVSETGQKLSITDIQYEGQTASFTINNLVVNNAPVLTGTVEEHVKSDHQILQDLVTGPVEFAKLLGGGLHGINNMFHDALGMDSEEKRHFRHNSFAKIERIHVKLKLEWKWDWHRSGYDVTSIDIRAGPLTVFTDPTFKHVTKMSKYVREVIPETVVPQIRPFLLMTGKKACTAPKGDCKVPLHLKIDEAKVGGGDGEGNGDGGGNC